MHIIMNHQDTAPTNANAYKPLIDPVIQVNNSIMITSTGPMESTWKNLSIPEAVQDRFGNHQCFVFSGSSNN